MKKINILPKPTVFNNKEKIILRDFLAMERTSLANERTLFSYIRAALYMAIGGVALLEYEGFATFRWLSVVVFVLSVLLVGVGVFRYRRLKHKLATYYKSMNLDTSDT